MNTLEKLLAKDAKLIWQACGEVTQNNNIDDLLALSTHLVEIKKATKGIDLGGALCSNSYHLEFVIKKLEYVMNHRGCLCALNTEYIFIDPEKEVNKNLITIDEEVDYQGTRLDYYLCHCNICFSAFKVEVSEGHFTSWKWIKLQTSI